MRRTIWKKVLCNERTPVEPTEGPQRSREGHSREMLPAPTGTERRRSAGRRAAGGPGRKRAAQPGGVGDAAVPRGEAAVREGTAGGRRRTEAETWPLRVPLSHGLHVSPQNSCVAAPGWKWLAGHVIGPDEAVRVALTHNGAAGARRGRSTWAAAAGRGAEPRAGRPRGAPQRPGATSSYRGAWGRFSPRPQGSPLPAPGHSLLTCHLGENGSLRLSRPLITPSAPPLWQRGCLPLPEPLPQPGPSRAPATEPASAGARGPRLSPALLYHGRREHLFLSFSNGK